MLQCISCKNGLADRWLDERPRGEEQLDVRRFIDGFWMAMPSPFGMGGFVSRGLALQRLALLDIPLLWTAPSTKVGEMEVEAFERALARTAAGEKIDSVVSDVLSAQRAQDPLAFRSGYWVDFKQAGTQIARYVIKLNAETSQDLPPHPRLFELGALRVHHWYAAQTIQVWWRHQCTPEEDLVASGTVFVTLRGCSNLPQLNRFGASDPYVVFTLGDAAPQKSTVMRNELCPKWRGQMFSWKFDSVLDFESKSLLVEVMDEEQWSPDQFMGSTKVELSRVMPLKSAKVTTPTFVGKSLRNAEGRYSTLRNSCTVQLSVHVVYNDDVPLQQQRGSAGGRRKRGMRQRGEAPVGAREKKKEGAFSTKWSKMRSMYGGVLSAKMQAKERLQSRMREMKEYAVA